MSRHDIGGPGAAMWPYMHPWHSLTKMDLIELTYVSFFHGLSASYKNHCHFSLVLCEYPDQVCWKCESSKGGGDLNYSYTNLHPNAAWRNTMWSSLPWVQTPELANCRAFDPKMLAADLLHVFHLGTGRDLLGSCLKILVQMRYFAGNSIEKSLGRASVRLRSFAQQYRLSLTLKKLTKQNLTWASDLYPEIKCKGYDTYIVLSWLVKEFEGNPPTSPVREVQDMLDEMCTALWSADAWLRMLMHAPMHLTDSQQLQKTVLGNIFMTTYVSLAQRALVERKKLWRVRPKIHLLHHMVLEDRPSRLNPHFMSTWMDEDFIKRTMRIKKKTHKRQSTGSTLSRWLLGLAVKLQETLEQLH